MASHASTADVPERAVPYPCRIGVGGTGLEAGGPLDGLEQTLRCSAGNLVQRAVKAIEPPTEAP